MSNVDFTHPQFISQTAQTMLCITNKSEQLLSTITMFWLGVEYNTEERTQQVKSLKITDQ